MKRYFFDLRDGTVERDTTGTELPGVEAARIEAIRFLGEVLKHEPERLIEGTLHVDVDEAGDAPSGRTRLFGISVLFDDAGPAARA